MIRNVNSDQDKVEMPLTTGHNINDPFHDLHLTLMHHLDKHLNLWIEHRKIDIG